MRNTAAVVLLMIVVAGGAPSPRAEQNEQQARQERADFEKFQAVLAFVRDRNARDYAITSPNGIDEGKYVEAGGIQQWITIRGEDRRNPVLLFLHGGPGDATNPWSYAAFRPWLKRFTVVQWDQRGTARTLGKNGRSSADTVSIKRLVQDGVELTELICKSLEKNKVVLVGHSFGSMIGVQMVKARPDLFHAYVGTAQVADSSKTYTVAHAELLKKAEALGDERAIRELREVGPPPYADGRGYAVQRRWSNFFEGADAFIPSMFGLALDAPGYTIGDINDWLDGQILSAERLVPEGRALPASALGGDFAVPVFVVQGAEDFTTPASLARGFVDSIRAPSKAFIPIAGGGHFAVFMKSTAFLDQLVSRVLPVVKER